MPVRNAQSAKLWAVSGGSRQQQHHHVEADPLQLLSGCHAKMLRRQSPRNLGFLEAARTRASG